MAAVRAASYSPELASYIHLAAKRAVSARPPATRSARVLIGLWQLAFVFNRSDTPVNENFPTGPTFHRFPDTLAFIVGALRNQ